MKDGVLIGDILELLDRQTAVDWNARPGSGGALQVTTQDRRSLAEIHLLQVDQLAGTVGVADSGPDGDRVHAGRCQSLFQEQFCRGLQDRVVRFLAAWPPALPCRGCRVAAHESLAPRPAAASDRTELTPTQARAPVPSSPRRSSNVNVCMHQ